MFPNRRAKIYSCKFSFRRYGLIANAYFFWNTFLFHFLKNRFLSKTKALMAIQRINTFIENKTITT